MENEILAGVVIAIVSGILGWAISQSTTGRKVAKALADMTLAIERNGNDAHRAQDEVSAVRSEVAEVRLDTTNRMCIMGDMVKEVLRVASELIEVVRVQNALLAESHKNKQP